MRSTAAQVETFFRAIAQGAKAEAAARLAGISVNTGYKWLAVGAPLSVRGAPAGTPLATFSSRQPAPAAKTLDEVVAACELMLVAVESALPTIMRVAAQLNAHPVAQPDQPGMQEAK